MAYDGSLKFDTKIDRSGFENGLNKMKTAATVATTAIVAGFGAATKAGMDFEAGMSKVGAISMASAEDMELLTEKAKQMGIETVFSATQSAEALQYMAMAGWKTEDMLNGLEGIMNLAAASGEDLGMVSDIVTDALTAFGLQAKDSAHFSDVLATASSNANTNVALMGETFKYVAPVAGALGFSVEDTSIAIGLMANAGIKGSQAGTALRSTLSRLSKPTKQTQEAMDALGISLTGSDGKMKSLNELMLDMRTSFSGLATEQKAAYAAMLGGQEAMSGLLAIVNASDEDFKKLTNAVNDADGAAKQMSETMLDNLSGQLTLMQSSAEGLGLAIYDGIEEPLKKAAKTAIKCINEITDSISNGEMSGALEEVGELFGNLVTVIIQLASAALPPLISALGFIGSHITEITAITIGLITAVKSYNALAMITKTVTTAWGAATAALTAMEQAHAITLVATNGGLTAFQTLVGVLTGKITIQTAATGLLTAAQTALNAAWVANPIGVVVAGVALLTTGIIALCAAVDTETESEKANRLAIEENRRAIAESTKAMKERKEAMAESAAAGLASIEHTQKLADELFKLAGADGTVAESQRGRAQFIIGELNSAYGTEISMVDGVIQKYDGLKTKLTEVTEAKKLQVFAEAAEEHYNQALLEQLELENNRSTAYAAAATYLTEYEAKQKAVADAQKAYNEALANNDGSIEYLSYLGTLSEKLDIAKGAAADYLSQHKDVLNAYWKAAAACDDNTASIARFEEAMAMAASGNTQGAIELLQEYTNAAKNGSMASAEFAEGTAEHIASLGSKIEPALQNYIAALKKYAEEGTEQAKGAVEAAKQELANAVTDYQNAGGTINDGMVTGFNAAGEVADIDLEFLLDDVPALEASAEKKAEEVGHNFGDGFANGINARTDAVDEAARALVDWAFKVAKEQADAHSPSRRADKEIGQMFGLGVAGGVKKSTPFVDKEARNLIDSAVDAAKDEAEIHSPGVVPEEEIGLPFGEGVAVGIEESTPIVEAAAEELVEDGISAGVEAVEKASENAATEIQDTIREMFGMESFKDVGESIAEDIAEGIEEGSLSIETVVDDVTQRNTEALKHREAMLAQTKHPIKKSFDERFKAAGYDSRLDGMKVFSFDRFKLHFDSEEEAFEVLNWGLDNRIALSQFKFIEHWNKELGIVSQSVEAWKDDVLVFSKEINNGVAKTTEGAFAKIAESSEESKKAFQEAYDVLEYKRKFDLITEEEYYDELAKIRDEHLDKGTKEWFDYTEKIYSYEKQCAEKQKEEIRSLYEDIASYAEENIDRVIEAQETLETKLKDYGGIYKKITISANNPAKSLDDPKETTLFTFGDLKGDIKALEKYKDALLKAKERIKNSGFDPEKTKGIFEMMINMDVNEGTEFANMLATVSDQNFDTFIADYIERSGLSETISKALYNDEFTEAVDDTKQYMVDKLTEAGYEIPEEFFVSGSISAEKFGEAFIAELDIQLEKIRSQIDAFYSSLTVGITGEGALKVADASEDDSPKTEVNQTFYIGSEKETSRQQVQNWQDTQEYTKRMGNPL